MKINWNIRLKNKTWLAALFAAILTFLFDLLDLLGVTPPIPQDTLASALTTLLTLLAALGVVIDPTTPGVTDTDEVMDE